VCAEHVLAGVADVHDFVGFEAGLFEGDMEDAGVGLLHADRA